MLSYVVFFFQAEDGIRDLVRSRGLGDVYKRQSVRCSATGLRHHKYKADDEGVATRHPKNHCDGAGLSLIHI